MDKKVYITPALMTVPLSPVSMIATSLGDGTTDLSDAPEGEAGEYGDTKGSGDFDLWDE